MKPSATLLMLLPETTTVLLVSTEPFLVSTSFPQCK